MKAELFFEIGAEELPAKEILAAVDGVRERILAGLDAARLTHGEARVFATPRRLAVSVADVLTRQPDAQNEVLGPPARAAFKDGVPTKAAEGFAKGLGLDVSQLQQKETPKGAYVYATVSEIGQPALALLPAILERTIAEIAWKRSMRWGHGDATFARPVQWIVALLGGERIPVRYGDVESGVETRGHRFLAPAPFRVEGATQYLETLRMHRVLADVAERRARILEGAHARAGEAGGVLRVDDALVDEITQLVEWPVPMLGRFDPSYLEIPQEVLISEMREHQRYLSVVDAAGKLLPAFVVVANTEVEDVHVSLDGYRRVLSARFQDGRFFFQEDQKLRLEARAEKLRDVQYSRALGSIYEKVERVAGLASWLGAGLGVVPDAEPGAEVLALARTEPSSEPEPEWLLARAALLMKADLGTAMVFEFPELQGVMGRAYAEKQGEHAEVAAAIEDHYLPRGATDALPRAGLGGDLGALLGLADRLDTIVGTFATGKGPTGAADPFGLRRAALGILRILIGRGWRVSLRAALSAALQALESKRKKPAAEVEAEVLEFFRARAKGLLTAEGIATDSAEAVLLAGDDDVLDALGRGLALERLRGGSDFVPLAATFKRVSNILKDQQPAELDPGALTQEAERALLAATDRTKDAAQRLHAAQDHAGAFAVAGELWPVVDRFFIDVMVMDPDPAIRAARLALLARVQDVFRPLADFRALS